MYMTDVTSHSVFVLTADEHVTSFCQKGQKEGVLNFLSCIYRVLYPLVHLLEMFVYTT